MLEKYIQLRKKLGLGRKEFGLLMNYGDPYMTVYHKEKQFSGHRISESDRWKMQAIEFMIENNLLEQFKTKINLK